MGEPSCMERLEVDKGDGADAGVEYCLSISTAGKTTQSTRPM